MPQVEDNPELAEDTKDDSENVEVTDTNKEENVNVSEMENDPKTNEASDKKVKAKALYDNIAETVDELAFRKGDILTVIEQDTDGMQGWWLCTLRGRQGICPGNRLKIINYDSGIYSPLSSPCSSSMGMTSSASTLSSQTIQASEMYENTSNGNGNQQKQGKRRSWHIMPNKVVTPHKYGDVYLYDLLPPTPTSSTSSASLQLYRDRLSSPYMNQSIISSLSIDSDNYDVPKPAVPINYDTPRAWNRQSPSSTNAAHLLFNRMEDSSYDVPRPANSSLMSNPNLTPSSSNSSLLTSDSLSLSLSSSNRSSLANMPEYDVPKRNPMLRHQTPPPTSLSTLTLQSIQSNELGGDAYDVPPHHNNQPPRAIEIYKELPLELSSALETLARLQNEATTAVSRLLAFVSPNWRTRDKLEPVLMDVKLAAVRLKTALHDLAEFGDGALGNAAKAEDKGLALKLKPLVKALRDADKLIHEASKALDIQGWTVDNLQRPETIKSSKVQLPPDSLDQMIACAQTLTDDVRQIASFIQGNSTLLFKRNSSTPQTPVSNNNNGDWPEDYDYVSLESKEASAKKNAEIRDALPKDLKKNFENVVRNAESAACNDATEVLDPNDKSVLLYYASQTVTHMGYLTQAIDAFLQTVEHNQPPKFFLAYGKFVVLSAHNLVNIGDIVHRNVSKKDVKTRVLSCADALSEALKTCVAKTKKAAQHFPSVTAVQEMVDSVVDISHLASDLKIAMLQAVQVHQ